MNSSTLEHIDLPYVSITYKCPIICFAYKEGAELGFPEIKELISHAEKLSNYKPYVTLADARVSMNITNEGKRYVSDLQNMPLFRGTAVLVKNSLYQFAVNFANTFNSNKYPFRAFTSEEKAIEWLISLSLHPDLQK